MAFNDYTDLRIAVSEQVGNREISDVLDRFTKTAEAWVNRELRCREQLTVTTLAFTAGSATLPTDFVEVAALADAYGHPLPTGVRSVTVPLSQGYTVTASSIVVPGLTGSRELEYYAKVPTLTASNATSNWLLQKSPNFYLYFVSYEAAKWLKDRELAADLAVLLADEERSLKWADLRGRFGSSTITTEGYGI